MTNEFKKISKGKETRYILESASIGATGSGAVPTVSKSTKGIITREGNKPTKVPQKPRQGPLRPQTGAGRHQDKKKDEKQGKAKHKKPFYEEVKEELGQLIAELKNTPNPDPKKISHFQQLLQKQKDRFSQQGFARAANDTDKLQKKYREPISELEKPSGTLYIILLRDRTESVRVIGDFATFPAEVQARASKVGIKDKEGRKERPLKVNFLMTSASQALAELDKALADVDFIGGEKAEFVFKNSAFETDIEAEVQELHELISSGADERFKNYEEPEVGNEPARKLKGVDHYIVDPVTGEKEKVKKPGKPDRQLGGHSVQQPKTYTYRLQRTDLAPKLRDMGFKFDGNSIILSKQQRDQLLAKMGDKQFGMIFGQGDRFAEGQEGSDENYMNQTVSDLHREIYGFGPGKQFVYEWQKMSFDEKVKVYNKLKHLAGKLEEARYRGDNRQFSYGGRPDPTDSIPQDSTAGQEKVQAMVDQMKQRTINNILTLKPGWGHSDLALMTATELNQILRDLQAERVKKGQSEGAQKKPNATTRHLRDYPVSDKDVAKPVQKPEKKKPEQGVAEAVPFSYGFVKPPRKGSVADLAAKKRKEQEKGKPPIEPKDQMVGVAKVTKGVAEGSLETDNMVSHIGQVIQSIYPRGGDKNTYMKLVAQEMPRIVKANPKLFRRAFGMAYDRFFHIDQDDDFDYTDYSMRKGERGMAESSKRCPQCGSTNCTCPPGKCNCKPVKGWLAKKEVDEEKQRLDPSCWKGYKKQGTKMKGGVRVNNCVPKEDTYIDSLSDRLDEIMEDWQKVNKKDKTDGMSQKAVNAYRRENPGSKLKTAVTTKPSKLKKGSKSAKRRKSFCSRMSGMKKAHASAKTKRDPDSPINKALRRWNCEESVQLDELKITQLPYKGQKQEKKAPFAFGSKHIGAAGGKGTSKGKLSGLGAATRKDGGKPVVKAEEGFGSKLAGLGLAAAAMMPGQADARVNIDDPNSYKAPAPIVQQQKIDYTKPGPVSKDSMGQKLEYGIPVTPEGKFKAPSQDLPDDEYAQQLKAYKSWKADFMSRWPDAVWNSDGSAKSNIKPGLAPMAPGYKPGSGQGLAPVFPGAQKESYIDDLNSMLENILGEKAPPGDKYERMVKHIKKGYAKDGKLSDKERGIAYATAWKAKNKAKK